MLRQAVLVHGYNKDYLYFIRAKFAVVFANGIRLPFFSNFITQY
ncbi:hypothetical protein OEV98_14310 [Caldibacillus lycopersici]|uniref:Uncharacterized protein n=1 Tax=Perspicuibacillus lycopersici TaxID=1325689 RepID=A0AAE3LTY1_9BACI|nr:RAxF-45 family protein [Perspicuibacillus lycopersici]MCU9614713.1 hypothetical protein [Perspicuibacillus lycopersici]